MLPLALALAQAAVLAGAPCTLPTRSAESLPFASGELLTYDLELAFVRAGRLTLQVDRPMSRGEVLPLKARAQTTAAVANMRRIVAVALSWISSSTLRPERYREEGDEGGVRRSTDVRIDAGAPTVTLDQRRGAERGPKVFDREGEVMDALSALYYLRAARLPPEERFCLDLVAAGRYWRVTGARAGGRETVDTPAGRFETFRVDAEAARADLPPGAKGRVRPLHVWLSDDARRIPVSIVSEIDLGPVSATLTGK